MTKIIGKNILVTGGVGFIGSHMVEDLSSKGCKVIVPYRNLSPKSYFSQKKLKNKVRLLQLDITDKQKLQAIVKRNNIDYIFHLAAKTIVTEAYDDPHATMNDNIMGTVSILEAARVVKGVRGVVFASSDKAYGKTKEKYLEHSPLKGDHPYDVSKSSADLIAQAYYKTYKTPVIIARFGNVYGEGDLHMDRIIPGICEAIIRKKPLAIRSNGKYVRDYIYVKDVVDGYMLLLDLLEKMPGEAFNFSSDDSYSVLDLVEKIEKILNVKIKRKILNRTKNEIPYQHLNDRKIRQLGWKPKYSLNTTIEDIMHWYKGVL